MDLEACHGAERPESARERREQVRASTLAGWPHALSESWMQGRRPSMFYKPARHAGDKIRRTPKQTGLQSAEGRSRIEATPHSILPYECIQVTARGGTVGVKVFRNVVSLIDFRDLGVSWKSGDWRVRRFLSLACTAMSTTSPDSEAYRVSLDLRRLKYRTLSQANV